MSEPVIAPGDKLHIITRRLFANEVRRHFVGEVIGASDGPVEIKGYTFVFHMGTNEYHRRPEVRIRIFSLADAGHIVNKLSRDADIGALQYRPVEGHLVVTDGKSFKLDINEFGLLS